MIRIRPSKRTLILMITLSCSFWTGAFLLKRWYCDRSKSQGEKTIQQIISHPCSEYRLPHSLLTQLLNITPQTSLMTIDLKRCKERLQDALVFEDIRLSKAPPSTLYISYRLRRPVAQLAAIDNIGVDQNGTLFPLYPFYTPLALPSLFLPLSPQPTVSELQQETDCRKEMAIGLNLLSLLTPLCKKNGLSLTALDLSRSTHSSFFRREIIATLSPKNEKDKLIYLRLNTKQPEQTAHTLSLLLPHIHTNKSGTIDLRFKGNALVSEELIRRSTS